MLKLASEMDEDTRVKCLLSDWTAVDENCGTLDRDSKPLRLIRSNGRRKAGRPTKYWLMGTSFINAPTFYAYSDEQAVEQANETLE